MVSTPSLYRTRLVLVLPDRGLLPCPRKSERQVAVPQVARYPANINRIHPTGGEADECWVVRPGCWDCEGLVS